MDGTLQDKSPNAADPVLEVRGLSTHFALRQGVLKAVENISFTVKRGKTLCIVGESGSGKSVAARSILQIVPSPGKIVSGQMVLHRRRGSTIDLAALDPRSAKMRAVRGARISMIFQEPMSSLSPVHKIGFQIEESLVLHTNLDKPARRKRVLELLRQVEISEPEAAADRYPFEYSGGMRQRAMIAMALACEPDVLIADEPTTALDVTTQAEILDLIARLQADHGMGVMFITHDMGVVAEIADEVCVMFRGKVVEQGPVDNIFHAPEHPYTRMLIGTARKLEARAEAKPPFRAGASILMVEGLTKTFEKRTGFIRKTTVRTEAVKSASFTLRDGETLGIVGESGSGKTTLGQMILRTVEPTAGKVLYHGRAGGAVDVTALNREGMRDIYGDIRMVFQDPHNSLNPRMTVEQIIAEPLRNSGWSSSDSHARVKELLDLVGLPAQVMERYPHAFSGGQRQRIGIARALAPEPRIIVADEATSALDVSLRAQVLELLLSIQKRMSLSFLFISHDISVIRYFCDRVAVMRQGEIVEIGEVDQVCTTPQHGYTKALLSAVPHPNPRARRLATRHRYKTERTET
ncbi:ABC transporter ATP-binding protein [Roseobacter weihaiensis]|uniref:ABC transporter ATP-binding protein n=1 Tax=Roseobacter weihaiensis TaxID=2763262 RepID=UPI001D09E487|nr:ABC transporter ATP-binding protein [Roseobacter sp. H9]